jgi:hypothetical protein
MQEADQLIPIEECPTPGCPSKHVKPTGTPVMRSIKTVSWKEADIIFVGEAHCEKCGAALEIELTKCLSSSPLGPARAFKKTSA